MKKKKTLSYVTPLFQEMSGLRAGLSFTGAVLEKVRKDAEATLAKCPTKCPFISLSLVIAFSDLQSTHSLEDLRSVDLCVVSCCVLLGCVVWNKVAIFKKMFSKSRPNNIVYEILSQPVTKGVCSEANQPTLFSRQLLAVWYLTVSNCILAINMRLKTYSHEKYFGLIQT